MKIVKNLLVLSLSLILAFGASCNNEVNILITSKVEIEELNILIMGDSLITKSDWVDRLIKLLDDSYKFTKFKVVKSAKSGETSYDAMKRIDSVLDMTNPDLSVLAYGTNDTGTIRIADYKIYMEMLVVKSLKTGSYVLINTIGPIMGKGKEDYKYYNNILELIEHNYDNVEIIDVKTPLEKEIYCYYYANFTDGMHYSQLGASIVAETVFKRINEYLVRGNK